MSYNRVRYHGNGDANVTLEALICGALHQIDRFGRATTATLFRDILELPVHAQDIKRNELISSL